MPAEPITFVSGHFRDRVSRPHYYVLPKNATVPSAGDSIRCSAWIGPLTIQSVESVPAGHTFLSSVRSTLLHHSYQITTEERPAMNSCAKSPSDTLQDRIDDLKEQQAAARKAAKKLKAAQKASDAAKKLREQRNALAFQTLADIAANPLADNGVRVDAAIALADRTR